MKYYCNKNYALTSIFCASDVATLQYSVSNYFLLVNYTHTSSVRCRKRLLLMHKSTWQSANENNGTDDDDDDVLGVAVEDGAAVDAQLLGVRHGLGARLGREDAAVTVALQLRQEEVIELLRLHFLQTETTHRT